MTIPTLYEQLLGPRFAMLEPAVRRFHRLAGHHQLIGQVRTQAPTTPLARLLARWLGTPRQTTAGCLRFELDAQPESEHWTRHFPRKTMRSTLVRQGENLVECLGPVRLSFQLEPRGGRLVMRLTRLQVFGLHCPRWALPQVVAQESGARDQLHFEVRASWPLVGQVASYAGHLDLPAEEEK